MQFRILGPLEVAREGRTLALGGSRQRLLLALLLTRANQVVSSDRLVEELWGGTPPGSAANALQYHVSQLRKALAPSDVVVTREPGYLIEVHPGELDLVRFEQLVAEARLAGPERAAEILREALGLWRGPPFADLAEEPAVQADIRRLEELRLEGLELRIDADLALGRHAELIPELQGLAGQHPLRERLRALLMRALYASGRQAEALDVYRETRRELVEKLGIEPSRALHELEQAILRQDPALAAPTDVDVAAPAQRAIMAAASDERRMDDLVAIAEPLARKPTRELILARLLREDEELTVATTTLAERRSALSERGVSCRIVAYTTPEPGGDAVLLATEHDVDLVLVDAPLTLVETGVLDEDLATILAGAPCDVGVLVGSGRPHSGSVVTPFGGAEHDWSAIEVAAWLAASLGTRLRMLGTKADPTLGRRDASRLLARASLMVQQVVGIVTEPVLISAGEEGVLNALGDARLIVVGLSERWRSEGLGTTRLAVAVRAGVPTLFVRRGLRPSGLAPHETMTRFTWTLGSQGAVQGEGRS